MDKPYSRLLDLITTVILVEDLDVGQLDELINRYRADDGKTDVFIRAASYLFHVGYADVTTEQREQIKDRYRAIRWGMELEIEG